MTERDEEGGGGGGKAADGPAPLAECVPDLFRYARFLLGDSPYVEDVVQETMVRAISSLSSYDPERPLRAWLRGIALHVAHKYWRRVRRARSLQQSGEPAPGPAAASVSPEDELLLRERAELLYRALDTLSPPLREALVLHVAERRPAEEVATLVGTTVTNVYTRVSRARALVREFLGRERRARSGGEEEG